MTWVGRGMFWLQISDIMFNKWGKQARAEHCLAQLKLATTSSKLATNQLGASYPLATYQLVASKSSVGPQNYYAGCRLGVGWFPTVLIIRLSQPTSGDWLAGLGWAWQLSTSKIGLVGTRIHFDNQDNPGKRICQPFLWFLAPAKCRL